MRKGKNVIGKDVLSYIDGRKVHSVKDLIIGMENDDVVALLVSEGGLFSTAQIVPMENVVSFGKDAVVISDSNAAIPADSYPAVQEILDRKDKLIGKKVFTEGGDSQGSVSDVFFEESSGRILGFEVSGGLINNVAKGTSYLPLEDIVNIGPDVVLIKSEAVYDLDAQVGGVQGALQSAGDKVGSAVDTAKEKVGDAAQNIGEAATDKQMDFVVGKTASREVTADDGTVIASANQVITRNIAERADRQGKLAALVASASGSILQGAGAGVEQKAEDAVIGRRAGKDIESDNGSIIVASGQRIGREHVELARSTNKLGDLLASAGLGQMQQAGDHTGAALGQAGDKAGQVSGQVGDKVGDAAEQTADKAGDLWDNFTRKISEMTDSAGKRVDEEKAKKRLSDIQDAIGRPVTKVILDKQDNVILNLGDLITHEAVQRAYDSGMLDTLLDNVYKAEVTFEKEELRAPGEAEATVDKASGNATVVADMEQKVEQAQQEREQQKEQKREEAEQKREGRAEEREQRAQERAQASSDGSNGQGSTMSASMSAGGGGGDEGDSPLDDAPTTEHTQASISDEEFQRGSESNSTATAELPTVGEGSEPSRR